MCQKTQGIVCRGQYASAPLRPPRLRLETYQNYTLKYKHTIHTHTKHTLEVG
jgi:hypothetical protein